MIEDELRVLFEELRAGKRSPDEALAALRRLPFADLGFARVDHHRHLRQSFPEAVYGPGKTPEQCAQIVGELLDNGSGPVLLTRASHDQAELCLKEHGAASRTPIDPSVNELSTLVWRSAELRSANVVVITAGTADLPVANECVATLRAHGIAARFFVDCGVAGIHRLVDHLDDLAQAMAIVVVAGMEGALASVVGGLSGAPIIAVPTSVGYGAAMEGITALLAMHSSCAAGVTVVGIDNGFGAASAILRMLA